MLKKYDNATVKNIVIYGAQGIALGTYRAIKKLYKDCAIDCFVVTKMDGNQSQLAGLPVKQIDQFSKLLSEEERKKIKVLIATPDNVMAEIEGILNQYGFLNVDRIDSVRWAELQEKAFGLSDNFTPLSQYNAGDKRAELRVFMAKFWRDKEIKGEYDIPNYCISIQAGAANTDLRVANLLDNEGDNISSKNGDYSELTALYWIYKNAIVSESNYYGLAHYRRFLELSNEDLCRLEDNDIDVILPYPMPYEPNIEEHHKRYLSDDEWNAVRIAVSELCPEHIDDFNCILNGEYMYNYNVIIAKGFVLTDYCKWLFNILFRVEELVNPNGSRKPNRYIGYIAETLETLYFMHNKDKLKIAHVGCRFLV